MHTVFVQHEEVEFGTMHPCAVHAEGQNHGIYTELKEVCFIRQKSVFSHMLIYANLFN